MEYRQLRSFVAVAERGSFNSASRDLNLSQSALSYQIRTLEEYLQVTLFIRHARGVTLSPAGEALRPLAERIVRDTAAARETFSNVLKGRVNFGVTPTPARLFVPHLLVSSAAETKLRLEIKQNFSGTNYADLLAGRLDLILCYAPDDPPKLRARALYEDDLFLVGPPDMVKTEDGDMPFKTLANYPLVVTDTANLARQWVEKLAQERNISLNVAHEVDMIDVQRQLVIGHRRCSLASWGLFLDELRLGNLGGRKIVEPVMSRQMRLLARPEFPEKLFDYIADKLQTSVRRMLATHRSDYWWLRLPRNKTADDQPGATASTE